MEKFKEQVENYGNLKFLTAAQITISKGVLNDSELKSFLAALDGALSKFEQESLIQFTLNASVLPEEQLQIDQAMEESFGRAMQLEQSLVTGMQEVSPEEAARVAKLPRGPKG